MGASKSSAPQQPTPAESAQAAVQATQAGDIYQMANAPLTGYADLYTQTMLGPNRAQLAQGLTNQQQLQSAMAQQDIQSRLDPQAYAMRKMNETAAQSRLAKIYGLDPSVFPATGSYPQAYATPSAWDLPSPSMLAATGKSLARLSTPVSVPTSGNPQIG